MPPNEIDTIPTVFPTELKIVEKAKVLPIVHDAVSAAFMLHTQVRDCNTVYNTVEDFVMDGIKEAGPTITGTITKEIATKINDATGYVAKSLGLTTILRWFLETFYINLFLIEIFGMKLVEVTAVTDTVVMEEPEQMRDETEASEMTVVTEEEEERAEMSMDDEVTENMEPEMMRDEMEASDMTAATEEDEERAETSMEDEAAPAEHMNEPEQMRNETELLMTAATEEEE